MSSVFITALVVSSLLRVVPQEIETIVLSEPVAVLGDTLKASYLYRIHDVAPGNGDSIYVLDSGDLVVVAFGRDGNELFRFGREGEGPGEFRRPQRVCYTGHSVLVSDYGLSRIVEFSPRGEYMRTLRLDFQPRGGLVFHDGMIYAGVQSSQYLIVRIPLDEPADYTPLLSREHPDISQFTELDMFYMGGVELGVSSGGLLAAFPAMGTYMVIPWNAEPDKASFIEPKSELIQEKVRERRGGLSRLFNSILEWPDGRIVLEVRTGQLATFRAICVFLDPQSGIETGPRIVASDSMHGRIHLLDREHVMWENFGSSTIDICRIPGR